MDYDIFAYMQLSAPFHTMIYIMAMYGMHPLKLIKYMHVALTPKTLRMQP